MNLTRTYRNTPIIRVALAAASLLAAGSLWVAPAPPPAKNVHLVREAETGRFWRGAAPRKDTLRALAASARERGVKVTLVDLRKPATKDDLSGRDSKLTPKGEAALAKDLGMEYLAISALDKSLPSRLEQALRRGDIYMHCMYGVNRTGFATARYARAGKHNLGTKGLGVRDWKQGDAFQARLEKRKP